MTTNPEGITIHGFINGSVFTQNQNFTFGNGQNAEFPVPPETSTDRWFFGGDVRNTRLTLGFSGPKLDNDMKVNATLEADFFGGNNGTGAFAGEQLTPRLRLAWVDLVKNKTTFRLGQFWSPLFGTVPQSYSHIAFPLGYGSAGVIGWRYVGLGVIQDFTPAGAAVTRKLTVSLQRGSWNGPGDNTNSGTAGNAAPIPQIEARFDWSTKAWNTYVVGHVDQKDLSGAGTTANNDKLTGWAVELGGKIARGPAYIQGNIYTGKAIGQQFGEITQFGDIKDVGAYLQAGYSFTPRWSVNLMAGGVKCNKDDVLAAKATRTKNAMIVPSLIYNVGPFGFSAEWLHDKLTTGAADVETSGDQGVVSVIYKF